jgi:hypothetical protein
MAIVIADGSSSLPRYDQPRTPDNLYLFDSNGNLMPGWPKSHPAAFDGFGTAPALADLDGDKVREVLFGTRMGQVFAYRSDGSLVDGWPQPQVPVGLSIQGMAVGDVDGDGKPEVVASVRRNWYSSGSSQYLLYVWHADGTLLPNWPKSNDLFTLSPILADIDGDYRADIVIPQADNDGGAVPTIYAYRYDGSLLPHFPKPIGWQGGSVIQDTNSGAAVADFDNDGKLNLAFVDQQSIVYMWDLDAPATAPRPWPMVNHDAQGSRCLSFGGIVVPTPTPLSTPTSTPTETPTPSRIFDIRPTRGRPGRTVILSARANQRFPVSSTILFNGRTKATILRSTKNRIWVVVPPTAESGRIFIKSKLKRRLYSAVPFRVVGGKRQKARRMVVETE